MKKIETTIQGVYILEPSVFHDNRGWFMETWSTKNLEDLGINISFIQDNQSYTIHKGTLRGIHFQKEPMAQTKLVRVTQGAVLDFVVDLRKESSTFKKWIAVELSENNKRQLFIPKGFGHAFLTLTDNVEFLYKCDNLYSKEHDCGIRFDDPTIAIEWGIDNPIISEKDNSLPFFSELF